MRISTKEYQQPCTLHSLFAFIPHATLVGNNGDVIINTQNQLFTGIFWSPLQWWTTLFIVLNFSIFPFTFLSAKINPNQNLWKESQSIQLTEKWQRRLIKNEETVQSKKVHWKKMNIDLLQQKQIKCCNKYSPN